MIDTKKLTVSASPHQKSADTTTGIMRDVIIALVPAGITAQKEQTKHRPIQAGVSLSKNVEISHPFFSCYPHANLLFYS